MAFLPAFTLAILAITSLAAGLAAGSRSASAEPVQVQINSNLIFTRTPPSELQLTKRVNFTTGPGVSDYCGETTPYESFDAYAPLASDCAAIAGTMSQVSGFYTLAPGDFETTSGWVTVASAGTCAFAVAFQEAANTTTALVGTNDIRFYVQSYAGDAKGGRIRAVGGIKCSNGNRLIDLNWGMVRNG